MNLSVYIATGLLMHIISDLFILLTIFRKIPIDKYRVQKKVIMTSWIVFFITLLICTLRAATEEIEVAPFKVAGENSSALLIKKDTGGEWRVLSDSIDGFVFTYGKTSRLIVETVEVGDDKREVFVLKKVLSQKRSNMVSLHDIFIVHKVNGHEPSDDFGIIELNLSKMLLSASGKKRFTGQISALNDSLIRFSDIISEEGCGDRNLLELIHILSEIKRYRPVVRGIVLQGGGQTIQLRKVD